MSQPRQLRYPFMLLAITVSLCITVNNQFNSKHSLQVQAETSKPNSSPSPTSTPTPSPTKTPAPTPTPDQVTGNNNSLLVKNDNNPLALGVGQWWKNMDSSDQVHALFFEKINSPKNDNGKLTIWYKDPAGLFTKDAEYKLVNPNKNEWRDIDIVLRKDRVIKTIFKIETQKANKRILHIQLKGLKPGNERPKTASPDNVKKFTVDIQNSIR